MPSYRNLVREFTARGRQVVLDNMQQGPFNRWAFTQMRRVRAIVGADTAVVISLDLHANVTDAMPEHCDAMTIYRTYPRIWI